MSRKKYLLTFTRTSRAAGVTNTPLVAEGDYSPALLPSALLLCTTINPQHKDFTVTDRCVARGSAQQTRGRIPWDSQGPSCKSKGYS